MGPGPNLVSGTQGLFTASKVLWVPSGAQSLAGQVGRYVTIKDKCNRDEGLHLLVTVLGRAGEWRGLH